MYGSLDIEIETKNSELSESNVHEIIEHIRDDKRYKHYFDEEGQVQILQDENNELKRKIMMLEKELQGNKTFNKAA